MSVIQADKIDAIGIDRRTQTVVLSISDHLDWSDPDGHTLLLQEKLNCYLRFVESGEIYESYPLSAGREVVFEVYGKFPLPPEGVVFFEQARKVVEGIGIELRFKVFNPAPIGGLT